MDLLPTIEDDDDITIIEEESDSEDNKKKRQKSDDKPFDHGFEFKMDGGDILKWQIDEAIVMASKKNNSSITTSIDAKIARARETRKLEKERLRLEKKAKSLEHDNEIRNKHTDIKENKSEQKKLSRNNDSSDTSEEEDNVSIENSPFQKEAFFSQAPPLAVGVAFTDMNLSRPLLKAVTSLGFATPTPIQAQTIPLALMGKDICGCAATGTGKTAAFMLPILERLLFRPTRRRIIRVLILLPTRELAIQVHSVGKTLAQNTNIELCLAAGGLESKGQEAALRRNPDIVVATPGRLVDHLHNTPSFSLQTVEILVLDEADRMLDEHFMDEMNEIIRLCPVSRQTLLFSATMTDEVEELIRLSLHEPVRVFVDSNTDTADNLYQEFVRIRTNREEDREAIVTALCLRTFKDHCLVFLPTKKLAHRLRIILGLLGVNSAELHGSLTQLQRLEALKNFKESKVDVLLATDLAARGLDIDNVRTVINYSMPPTLKQYIHRVGRTARAGKSGKSVSLVGEKGRKVLKEVVKQAKCPPKSRVIPTEVIEKYKIKIQSLENEIKDIMKQEEEEKELRVAEMEMNKAKNMVVHHEEIYSRPARVWFQDKKTRIGKRKTVGEGLPDNKKMKAEKTEEEKAAIREMEYAKRESRRAKKNSKLYAVPQNERKGKKGPKRPQPVIKEVNSDQQSGRGNKSKKTTHTLIKSKGNKFKSKRRYKRK